MKRYITLSLIFALLFTSCSSPGPDTENIPPIKTEEQSETVDGVYLADVLSGVDFSRETCDGIPEYEITVNGVTYQINETDNWIWRERQAEADLTAELYEAIHNVDDPNYANKTGIYMYLEDITPYDATLVVSQHGGSSDLGELQLCEAFDIEKMNEYGEWEALPSNEYNTSDLAYAINVNDETFAYTDWSLIYGRLDEGQYRLKKTVFDYRGAVDYDTYEYYAKFEITAFETPSEPPELTLIDALSSTVNEYTPAICNYEWSYKNSGGTYTGLIADAAMPPLNAALEEKALNVQKYAHTDAAAFIIKWSFRPDSFTIKEYLSNTVGTPDAEPVSEYKFYRAENPDILELKKDRIYVIEAEWSRLTDFSGTAVYSFAAE